MGDKLDINDFIAEQVMNLVAFKEWILKDPDRTVPSDQNLNTWYAEYQAFLQRQN